MSYISWLAALVVFFSDQVSKLHISHRLSLNQSIPVIKGIFHISLVHNCGVAFGLFKNRNFFFIILSLIAVLYILGYLFVNKRQNGLTKRIALGLILGGASGNLADRLRLGYIVDFLDFRVWPVFNIADSAITVGIVLLGYSILREK